MAINFPGPYEVQIEYDITVGSQVIPHFQRLNCALPVEPAVGDSFAAIAVTRRAASDSDLKAVTDAWIALLQPLYDDAAVNFLGATLYKYEDLSFVKNFKSSYTIGLAGTDTTVVEPARSDILTFHTEEGGEFRIVLLETNLTGFGVDFLPLGLPAMDNVADFILGTTNWILARDTSYPISFHRWLKGQNEKTFRQRYR